MLALEARIAYFRWDGKNCGGLYGKIIKYNILCFL